MEDPLRLEKIRSWIDEYLATGEVRRFERPARRIAPSALRRFLDLAVADGTAPEDLSLDELRRALVAAARPLAASERTQWPELCASFLRWCDHNGCIPHARGHAAKLAGQSLASLPPLPDPDSAAPPPSRRPAPPHDPDDGDDFPAADAAPRAERRVGPNAACPCGSGKKAKRCCYRYN